MTETPNVSDAPAAVHRQGNDPRPHGLIRRWFSPLQLQRIAVGAIPFVVLAVGWYVAAARHLADETFLPSMFDVWRAIVSVFTVESYVGDVWVSIYRVLAAFVLSAILAIPIGLLTGHHKRTADLVEPFIGFIRYMPVPAFVPLCILWFGIGDAAKIAVIWLGTFFQLILLIADVARGVPRDYFEAALTLGASRRQLFTRILWPASLPGIVSASRTAIGWAWTYLVVAEIAGATAGIGFRIMQAQRYVETPRVFAGIVVIGVLGMATDLLFQVIQKVSFRWG